MLGDDFSTVGNVQMGYDNLAIILQRTNAETGIIKTRNFLSRIVNRYTLYSSNPGRNGIERRSDNAIKNRMTSQSFFALLWKTVFNGMQNVMMKSGRYE